MKIEDLDNNTSSEREEDKRKRLDHYKTFKKKQENEMDEFKINIIKDDEENQAEAKENKPAKIPLYGKVSIVGEQLSGERTDSEILKSDTIKSAIRKKGRQSSAILDIVKIGPDSFRNLKDNRFSDDYTIINCIGQGGYGKVYRVKHNSMGYIRAMKSKKYF